MLRFVVIQKLCYHDNVTLRLLFSIEPHQTKAKNLQALQAVIY